MSDIIQQARDYVDSRGTSHQPRAYELARALVELADASQAEPQSAEPVAWRAQTHAVGGIPRYHYNEAGDGEPLYATPPDAAARIAELERERDEAFKMSRCECGPDECCANLVRYAKERDEALELLRDIASDFRTSREFAGYIEEIDALLAKHKGE